MEIQFQQRKQGVSPIPTSMFKGRTSKNKSKSNNKFVGVRQRPSGRWVAEIKDTTQKIRMWLGTFETAEEAARAYDEAACLLRGSNTRTNFVTHVSLNSPIAFRIQNLLNSKKTAKKQVLNSSPTTSSSSTSSGGGDNSLSNTTSRARYTSTSTTSSSSTTTSGDGAGEDFVSSKKVDEDLSQLFDDAYKPDLSNCRSETEKGISGMCNMSWGFGGGIDRVALNQAMMELPQERSGMELTEFERMKVERQISASLYAMNGVQEYMDTVHDLNEEIWDLPPLCSLFC